MAKKKGSQQRNKSTAKKSNTKKKAPSANVSPTPPAKKKVNSTAGSGMSPQMRNILLQAGLILGFVALLFVYFSPVTKGQVLQMADIQQFSNMSHEVREYREATGEEAFWTGSMFSGMPTFLTGLAFPNNLFRYIKTGFIELFPSPISYILLHFLGFFFLLRTLKVDPIYSFLGSLAFAFSSYFFIIMEAGHTSKAIVIGTIAPLVAGILQAYRGNYLIGGATVAFFTALQLSANHVQMSYYMALMLVIYGIFQLVDSLRNEGLTQFLYATGAILIAVLIGMTPSFGNLYSTYEYSQETIRGKSELTPPKGQKESSGLDIKYAYRWSYGIDETMTLLIPNYMGGASGTPIDRNSDAAKELRKIVGQVPGAIPTYWGDQPFTSGPVYVGAIICFLFFLGLFQVKGPLKWWLLTATLMSFMLSWGRHFPILNDFMFYNFPLYNKFRAVAMILVIAEFTMPLLAVLGLYHTLNYEKSGFTKAQTIRNVYISLGISGGLCLIFALMGSAFYDFSAAGDARYAQQSQAFVDFLETYRADMMSSDAWRSLGFIVAAAALIWFYIQGQLKNAMWVVGGLAALTLIDMWGVNQRFLNEDAFGRGQNYSKPQPSPADRAILQDSDPHYRVVNLTRDIFNSAATAGIHKDIGGYHPAKLSRYNELISRHIQPEIQEFVSVLRQPDSLRRVGLEGLDVLNMLNTKYMILQNDRAPFRNPAALGNAWTISEYILAENADDEIAKLKNVNTATQAVIDKRFEDQLSGIPKQRAREKAIVTLKEYSPNVMTYEFRSNRDELVIFSEIYYNTDKGWNAFIDGEPVPHFRANYVLRGLKVPSGNHTIEFKMMPQSYFTGESIDLMGSILVLLITAGALFLTFRPQNNKESEAASEV
ncbi:MAG: YfhO family protein [Bacteroidota bacterium]